jgi:hypothetical protein
MRYWKYIVGLIITSVWCVSAWAQSSNSCEDQLNAATAEFEAGRFYGIPAMLKPCIDKGFSREQRQRAYLLLTQTYLLLEDPIAAEDSYLKVLQANPEFLTDPARDPIEVVYLSKKFTADPIFSLFAKIGPNVAIARVIHDVDLTSSTTPTNEKYTMRPTVHVEVGADWHFYNRFSLSASLNYSSTSFKFEEDDKYGRDIEEMIERQNWLSIPLSVKYSDDIGKIRPYGFIGYSVNLLVSDNAQFNILNLEPNGISKPSESPSIDFMPKRNVLNRSFFLGGGVKLKSGLDYFFAEAQYAFGLSNIVNPDRVYNNEDGSIATDVFPYGHVDNYFRLDNLSVSIGYVHPLYKPRKLKTARTKGLLRSIKKQSNDGK